MSRHWQRRRHGDGTAALEVLPHPQGPWLVRLGRRVLTVPPDVGRSLLPLHGRRIAPAAGRARRRDVVDRTLPLRLVIVPAPAVRRAAGALAPLASNAGLAFSAAAGLVTVACLRPWGGPVSLSAPAVLLFCSGAVWHELGHATALRREGYEPGAVGAGLLVCLPVLYADVSAVSLLPRPGRLRVDLAGPAFQAGAAGLLALVGTVAALPAAVSAAARTAAAATLLALFWALLPLPRSDGSWALRDALAGNRGSSAPGRPAPCLGLALTVTQWVLAGLACRVLPARLAVAAAWLVGRSGRHLPPAAVDGLAAALTMIALVLWARGARRAWHRWRGRRARR